MLSNILQLERFSAGAMNLYGAAGQTWKTFGVRRG